MWHFPNLFDYVPLSHPGSGVVWKHLGNASFFFAAAVQGIAF